MSRKTPAHRNQALNRHPFRVLSFIDTGSFLRCYSRRMKPNPKDFSDKVLSPRELGGKKYDIPYVLSLSNKEQELIFFGVEHSRDPKDPYFSKMEKSLREFAERQTSKGIVGIEGYTPRLDQETKEEAIQKFGEHGLLMLLSDQLHIATTVLTAEPKELWQRTAREGAFSKVDSALWVFLNMLAYKGDKDFKETVENILMFLKKMGLPHSYDELRRRLVELTKREDILPVSIQKTTSDDQLYMQTWKKLQSPSQSVSILNDIGVMTNWIKDKTIAEKLISLLLERKSIFAVIGHNHVVAQEPALHEAWKTIKKEALA